MKIAVIFGGKSAEHEVACKSAVTILGWIDEKKYEIIKIGITKTGKWLKTEASLNDIKNMTWGELADNKEVFINPNPDKKEIAFYEKNELITERIDCVFPVLHGEHGEDGDIQGLLELAGIPYVGPGVLSSACCMDKSFTKQMALPTGIMMAKHVVVYKHDFENDKEKMANYIMEKHEGKFPLFVKSCSTGSSVGVTKASELKGLITSLEVSFNYDKKALVEEMIEGREIEVAVLGNLNPVATVPGEIITAGEFYDYDSKYNNPNSKTLLAGGLTKEKIEEFKEAAIKLYKALDCAGMARVDFFLNKDNEIIFNEINTIPGFTDISMYPKLWENEGIKGPELVDRLIELAMENGKDK
ncbi:MAG: D-alanine--D-alanine ligase [Peptostreptococcaceae bacterium]|nr:D-alanine--D-alanine ligase [Peptostreptococcaceae bacterium]